MDTALIAYRPMPKQLYIAREGHPFVGGALFLALVLYLAGIFVGFFFMTLVTFFVLYFFRNPERVIPEGDDLIVSPADGRILLIDDDAITPVTGSRSKKVSIFMSAFNVHINRSPISAQVRNIAYHAGKFFVASLDKASAKNERNAVVLQDAKGREIVMVQIAGWFARRIVCYLKVNKTLSRGDRFGLIRFGSRVDLYLPRDVTVDVKPGDKVKAGASIIGKFSA